jgi:hypothetical protein
LQATDFSLFFLINDLPIVILLFSLTQQ